MNISRFSELQITNILKQGETEGNVTDLCRQHGISSATFYRWRAKYGDTDKRGIKLIKELKSEIRILKKIAGEERIKTEIAKKIIIKKF
jgi:putative transposase